VIGGYGVFALLGKRVALVLIHVPEIRIHATKLIREGCEETFHLFARESGHLDYSVGSQRA